MSRVLSHRWRSALIAITMLACAPSIALAWDRVDGALAYVSIGSATNIWGVNQQGNVWQWNGSTWVRRPGVLVNISAAADGTVVGVNPVGMPFRWNGSDWDRMPGLLATISAGSSTRIWGIGTKNEDWPASDRRLFRWDPVAKNWVLESLGQTGTGLGTILAPFSSVSVDAEGDLWVTISYGKGPYIYFRPAGASAFIPIEGNLTQVSVGSAQYVMGVNASGNIWRWTGNTWRQVPGALKWVSVARDGTAWGVNASQNIFRMKLPAN